MNEYPYIRFGSWPGTWKALILTAMLSGNAVGQVTVLSSSFEGQWISPDEPLSIRLDRLPEANEGDIHLIIGNTDVTSLLTASPDGVITLESSLLDLPRGDSELVLYLVTTSGEWQEMSRKTLRVRLPGGFETSEFNPSINLTNKGQLDENTFGDAVESDRPRYQDLAGQIGFTSRHTREDLEVRTSLNMVGSSVREEALRFGEKGEDAPKLDLSDYLLEVEKGNARLALGHVSFGNNPLLINGVSNRGLRAGYRFGERVDVSVSSMNGTSIVGFSNILGLETRDHNISAASVGVELLGSSANSLRMEVTYMDASIQSLFNFDTGEVPDAETNRGFGLRLTGSGFSNRLRADMSIARSRYRNPNDPVLAQGDTLVKVRPTTDVARSLKLDLDILRNLPITETLPLSLSFGYSYDRNDPLYKSLAAFSRADWKANRFSLSGQLGQLGMQAQYTDGEDNIDNIPTILKTRTKGTAVSLSAPMAFFFGRDQASSFWWPSLSYSFNRSRQFALNSPDEINSGFNGGSHLPDQQTTSHNIGARWSVSRWNLGYSLSLNDQDNRQVGRKADDFKVLSHNLNVGVQATKTINLSGNFSLGRNEDRAQELERETRSWGVNINWNITQNWAASGSYNLTEQDDSQNRAESDSQTANAQLNWNFMLPAGGRKLPGQAFIRYALQDSSSKDQLFGFESDLRNWTINSGLSLNLF